jgi:hypothetical protein
MHCLAKKTLKNNYYLTLKHPLNYFNNIIKNNNKVTTTNK